MSTTYQVKGPDGQVHEFSGPDGATPAQVMAAASAHFGNGDGSQQTAAPAQQQQPSSSLTSGIDPVGGALTAMHSFEDMATFGQGDKLAAALATALQPAAHAIGVRTEAPKGYQQNLSEIRQNYSDMAGSHPVSALTGDVAGVVTGGGVLTRGLEGAAKLAKGVPYLGDVARTTESFLAPKAGQTVRNFGRSALGNSALSGGMSLANGDDVDQASVNAVAGGLGGAAVGEIANAGIRTFQGASAKGMLALAKAFKMNPDDLDALYSRFVKETGGNTPSMADLVNLKSEGEIGQMASRNSTIGEAADLSANMRTPELGQQQAAEAATTFPQTERGLTDLRNTRMDQAMQRGVPASQNPTYAKAVPINADEIGLLKDDDVLGSLRRGSPLRTKILKADETLRDNPDGVATNLTVDDFDNIRQAMRGKISSYANPASANHNPHAAGELGDLMDNVTGIASREVPEYGQALDAFKRDSQYIAGFRNGNAGKPIGALRPGLETSQVMSTDGQAGYAHGNQLYQSQSRLSSIAPGKVQPQEEFGMQHASQMAAGAATAPSPWSISHVMRSIPGMHFSDNVQQVIAKQLFSTDPVVVKQGIANLRRGKVLDTDITSLAHRVGGSAGLNIVNALQGQ